MKRSIRRSRARLSNEGFTLLELVIACTTLVVGVLGFSKAIYAWNRAAEGSRLKSTAVRAARRAVEDLQARSFDEVFALYNDNPLDDPPGVVGPGPGFAVNGLTPLANDLDGFVGQIVFPTAEVGGLDVLREDAVLPQLGMPRDLNADGVVDALDHSLDYRLLPVLVRVRWRGPDGISNLEVKTILGEFL